MVMRHILHGLIDQHGLAEVLDRIEALVAERLEKIENAEADQMCRQLEEAVTLAEKIEAAGLMPRRNQW